MSAHGMRLEEVRCDGCDTVLLRGGHVGGRYLIVVRPVKITAVDPTAPANSESRVDFCSAACALRYCLTEDPTPGSKAAVCYRLIEEYSMIVDDADVPAFMRWWKGKSTG